MAQLSLTTPAPDLAFIERVRGRLADWHVKDVCLNYIENRDNFGCCQTCRQPEATHLLVELVTRAALTIDDVPLSPAGPQGPQEPAPEEPK